MTAQTAGLLIGGLVPAVLFAFANLSAKAASQAGIGIGAYVVSAGAGVVVAGLLFLLLTGDRAVSPSSGFLAGCVGFGWGIGIGCVVIALNRYGTPIGVLAPLFNMNTLITVLLALWIFSEWQQVKVPQLLLGSAFIVVGGALVARA